MTKHKNLKMRIIFETKGQAFQSKDMFKRRSIFIERKLKKRIYVVYGMEEY